MSGVMSIPDGMPMLKRGAHKDPSEGACVMEYISLLAGEEWSDGPSCTHPHLAAMARQVNDTLGDDQRHLLVPLIGRLIDTSDGADMFSPASKAMLTFVTTEPAINLVRNVDGSVIVGASALVDFLSRMIDVYDEVSGRTQRVVEVDLPALETKRLALAAS